MARARSASELSSPSPLGSCEPAFGSPSRRSWSIPYAHVAEPPLRTGNACNLSGQPFATSSTALAKFCYLMGARCSARPPFQHEQSCERAARVAQRYRSCRGAFATANGSTARVTSSSKYRNRSSLIEFSSECRTEDRFPARPIDNCESFSCTCFGLRPSSSVLHLHLDPNSSCDGESEPTCDRSYAHIGP